MMIGFDYFDTPPAPHVPTTQELLAKLTAQQKLAILDGFAKRIIPARMKYTAPKATVIYLYEKINEVKEWCKQLMGGKVKGQPVPKTLTELKSAVAKQFSKDFTAPQCSAIVDKMVKYSKWDGGGTFTFYKSGIATAEIKKIK